MRYSLISLFLYFFSCLSVFGQDLIVTSSGDSLDCKITEVRSGQIFFRYETDGYIVSLPMAQVASFQYGDDNTRRSGGGMSSVSVSMRGRSELSVYLGGGMSSLNYSHDAGSLSFGTGGLFGIGFTWFITGRWGLLTGVEASLYRSKYVADAAYANEIPAMSGTLGALGADFIFSYEYQNFSEKQSALFLQIPVMAQFQTGRFFASAGIKIGIPTGSAYHVNAANLTTSGNFPAENQIYDSLPDRGLGDIGKISYQGKNDLNINYAAAFETGGQWLLGRRTNLYAGVWLDYGLNNISKTGAVGIKKSVVEYDHTIQNGLKYNSIIDTSEKANVFSAGVKLKLTYSL